MIKTSETFYNQTSITNQTTVNSEGRFYVAGRLFGWAEPQVTFDSLHGGSGLEATQKYGGGRRAVISQQSISMSVPSSLMCWLRVGPSKGGKNSNLRRRICSSWPDMQVSFPGNTHGFKIQSCFIACCYDEENWKNTLLQRIQVSA